MADAAKRAVAATSGRTHLMNARAHHMSYTNGSGVCASSALLREPHVKLRVARVCLVWGEHFADFFARYCVRSLLEPRNIPLISFSR